MYTDLNLTIVVLQNDTFKNTKAHSVISLCIISSAVIFLPIYVAVDIPSLKWICISLNNKSISVNHDEYIGGDVDKMYNQMRAFMFSI